MNIFHPIVTYILHPKGGSHTKVTNIDALLMYKIINHQPINFLEFILWHMTHLSTYKLVLPHRMYWTKVFKYFDVNLANKEFNTLQDMHPYSKDSTGHMHYFWDDTHQAYYYQLNDHHIWLYSLNTPPQYLPKGCTGPSKISLKAIESSSDVKQGEVPLPNDKPIIEIDVPLALQQHHQRISYGEIEPYLQTISASIISLFTHMTKSITMLRTGMDECFIALQLHAKGEGINALS